MLFGDLVAKALSSVGITEERVQLALGKNCGCKRRRQQLNQLDTWARQQLTKGIQMPIKVLATMIGVSESELTSEDKDKDKDKEDING